MLEWSGGLRVWDAEQYACKYTRPESVACFICSTLVGNAAVETSSMCFDIKCISAIARKQ